MSLLSLPEINFQRPSAQVQFGIAPKALSQWNSTIQAVESGDEASISILDVIGQDYWTGEGVTSKRIAGALRSIGSNPVTVNVNSPGGDMFEGVAIYNMLREHPGHVTVKVLGMAASAASIIAMAGDTIQIGLPAFFMIHNGWIVAAGNRNELRDLADWMEPFDAAMADVYAARTGIKSATIQELMDKETWLGGSASVEQGFADEVLDGDQIRNGGKSQAAAARRIEAALRASGLSRSDAQGLISNFKSGLRDSAGNGGLSDSAANSEAAVLLNFLYQPLKG
ncbi:head maturation protease, ClpP-related [Pandoraea sp. PE-S2R-1]|uniref:head maturation protease, ClpP-related n=1 Tax=Pandoraea sp. PE-S2R-1 TaxID=1986994 RepID=UPI000B404739|nr:head maturation protease, ClpP-related [Pandoraea sp. PE-S2R-1]